MKLIIEILTAVTRLIGLTVEGVLPRVDKSKRELLKIARVKVIRNISTAVTRLVGLTVADVLPRVNKSKRELLRTAQVRVLRDMLIANMLVVGTSMDRVRVMANNGGNEQLQTVVKHRVNNEIAATKVHGKRQKLTYGVSSMTKGLLTRMHRVIR